MIYIFTIDPACAVPSRRWNGKRPMQELSHMPPSSPSTLFRQITLPSLIAAHGRVHGDKPLFIEGDATMTWRQFDRTTNRIANGPWRMGKRKGERIGLLAFNTIFAYC